MKVDLSVIDLLAHLVTIIDKMVTASMHYSLTNLIQTHVTHGGNLEHFLMYAL